MSAVSELKTIASIRDNMSTGLMAIQKEQQRIRNEMQGAKEVLKGTLVKKWSIKLQAGELLKCMWELVKEIGLLREQLAMIPQGLIGEKYSVGTLAVEHIVLQNLVPTNDNEEKPENSTLNLRNFDNESNIDENNIKKESDGLSAEMLTSAISGLIILAATRNPTAATAVGTGAAAAAGTEGSAAAGAAKTVEKWGPFVAKSSEKWTKRASEYIDGASKTASNFEQQELRYDHALSIFSPKKEADEIKAERENYMKQLMDSAVYDGFKIDDMFDAGITGLDITGGDTKKAMEYIKIAKNIVGWNPGSTVEEVMEALSSAKQGKLDELRSFGTVISAKDFENKGFEEVLQNNIAPQFKDGTTRRMNTLDGLETASESAKEIDRLFSGKIINNIKKFGLKSKLSIRNGISEIFRSNVVYEVPREREFPGPERIFGMPWAPEMNSTSGIMEKPKKDNQSNNTTVLSPQFTLNFNGTNMSPREMASVIVKHVRIAYDNLSSPSNRNAGFGGAHA